MTCADLDKIRRYEKVLRDIRDLSKSGVFSRLAAKEALVEERACDDCERSSLCIDNRARWLCNDCWHRDREKEPCFSLARTEGDYQFFLGGDQPSEYTRREAELVRSDHGEKYQVVPGEWQGVGKIAHPGCKRSPYP